MFKTKLFYLLSDKTNSSFPVLKIQEVQELSGKLRTCITVLEIIHT